MVDGIGSHLRQEAAADLFQSARHRGDGLPLEQILGGAAEDEHPTESDYERGYSDVGDPEPLPGTDQRTHAYAHRDAKEPWHVVAHHQDTGHRPDEAGDRP